MAEIDDIRTQIDKIDEEIVLLLANRLFHVKRIAELKAKSEMPMRDPARESRVMESVSARADRYRLDRGYVKDIFERIIKESHNVHGKGK